jgi:DNA-binding NtrC family response regulator
LAISELRPDKNCYGVPRLTLVPPVDDTGLKSLARSVKKEAEAEAISHALEQTKWHRQKAATMLRISYRALLYKIKQYQLEPPDASAETTP